MIVYWSAVSNNRIPFVNYQEPEPVFGTLVKNIPSSLPVKSSYASCPAFQSVSRNTFSLHTPINYELNYTDTDITTTMWDKGYFMETVTVRDYQFPKLGGMKFNYVFVCEQDLEIELMPCFLTSNEFTDNADIIPGRFNIGKWFRPLDCAYMVKSGNRTVKFVQGEPFAYVRFNTTQKVKLKKFYWTPELDHIVAGNISSRDGNLSVSPLSYFYNLYTRSRIPKIVMREIKNNLME